MLLNAKRILAGLALVFFAIPVWARPDTLHTDVARWEADHATTIGTTQLEPGNYQFKARESQDQLEVVQDGRVVAQIPCHWIQLPTKAANTEITIKDNQVVQVQFEGRTEAVQIQ